MQRDLRLRGPPFKPDVLSQSVHPPREPCVFVIDLRGTCSVCLFIPKVFRFSQGFLQREKPTTPQVVMKAASVMRCYGFRGKVQKPISAGNGRNDKLAEVYLPIIARTTYILRRE